MWDKTRQAATKVSRPSLRTYCFCGWWVLWCLASCPLYPRVDLRQSFISKFSGNLQQSQCWHGMWSVSWQWKVQQGWNFPASESGPEACCQPSFHAREWRGEEGWNFPEQTKSAGRKLQLLRVKNGLVTRKAGGKIWTNIVQTGLLRCPLLADVLTERVCITCKLEKNTELANLWNAA